MSKLPKAPLIEVIFEIRWSIEGEKEAQDVKYLPGDLYPLLKQEYPYREAVNPQAPVEFMLIHAPNQRFRYAKGDYPLVQVGPGIVTVNTVDAKYFWNKFEAGVMDVFDKVEKVYKFKRTLNLALTYVDLLKFDFEKDNVLRFWEEYLGLTFKQSFLAGQQAASNALLALSYPTELGTLNVTIGRGKDNKGHDGIAVTTNLISGNIEPKNSLIKDWLNKSHELSSNLFKEMTKGKLYESFK